MRFLGEISSMTSDLNQPENHFQDISRTCRKVIDEVKHGHNPKTSISAYTTLHWVERYCKVLESIAAKYRRLGPDRAELLPVALPSSKTNRHVPYTSNTQPIQYQRNIALISFPPAPYHIAIVPDQSTTPTQCCLHVFQAKNVHCVILNSVQ